MSLRRLLLLAVGCWAVTAFASDSKEEAQQKIDDAMKASCGLVKKNVAGCPDEHRAMAGLDCADKAARASVDFLKLNVACAKRQKLDAGAR